MDFQVLFLSASLEWATAITRNSWHSVQTMWIPHISWTSWQSRIKLLVLWNILHQDTSVTGNHIIPGYPDILLGWMQSQVRTKVPAKGQIRDTPWHRKCRWHCLDLSQHLSSCALGRFSFFCLQDWCFLNEDSWFLRKLCHGISHFQTCSQSRTQTCTRQMLLHLPSDQLLVTFLTTE